MGALCAKRSSPIVVSEAARPDPKPVKSAVSAETHRKRGNDAFKKEDFDRAVSAYSDAIDLEPTDASLWVNRSHAHRSMQSWDKAVSDADRALEMEPFNDKAHYSKSLALQKSGKYDEALEAIAAGLKTDPDNRGMLQMRINVEMLQKRALRNPDKAKAAQEPAQSKKRDYSINYSKWKDIVDSDEEEEKKKEYKLIESKPADGVKEVGDPVLGFDVPQEQRDELLLDMIEVVSKMQQENKDQILTEFQSKNLPTPDAEDKKVLGDRLPPDYEEPVGVISLEQLHQYTCSNDRMLVSVYGRIFDVSCRPDEYGNGPKSWYSGHDITWALVCNDAQPKMKDIDRFYDIFKARSEDQLNRLLRLQAHFLSIYQKCFTEVGRLDKFDVGKEALLPEPPTLEVESCPQQ